MRLVVDANILFAALITQGSTADLLFRKDLEFFSPEFLQTEIEKYHELLVLRSRSEDFEELLSFFLARITLVEGLKFVNICAETISPDPNDLPYLALAKYLQCPLWSNDKQLKNQQEVKVYTTKELMKHLEQQNFKSGV